jgi:hypothetical protein
MSGPRGDFCNPMSKFDETKAIHRPIRGGG